MEKEKAIAKKPPRSVNARMAAILARWLRAVRGAQHIIASGTAVLRATPSVSVACRKAWYIYRHDGMRGLQERLRAAQNRLPTRGAETKGRVSYADSGRSVDVYSAWLSQNSMTVEAARRLQNLTLAAGEPEVLISVLMPVYNTEPSLLGRAIESLRLQIYPHWELCIADDCSTNAATLEALEYWAEKESRIRIVRRSENGNISAATNDAASIARGIIFVFLDHDDELAVDALAEVAIFVKRVPTVDYIYSDDDKINTDGDRFGPQFKPGFAPILLLSCMYMGHIKAVRGSVYRKLGGFRGEFDGSQDYDFALRMAELSENVGHIPKVLYHWRAAVGSTAAGADEKPKSIEAGRQAVAEALVRRGVRAEVYQPDWAAKARVGVYDLRFPNYGPTVTIVIPTKNQKPLLSRCLESIAKTTYVNYEVLVVDNESDDLETLHYLRSLSCKVLSVPNRDKGQFNYSYINNEAIKVVDSEYVLFLNNDTEVIGANWLSQMMGYAQMSGVGAVGAKLFFADRTIQHAGVVHGLNGGLAGPAFRGLAHWDNGYQSYAAVTREYAAVTAACMLIRRDRFLDLGGFDENTFAVAYNDVDLCYRLVDRGYSCVYCHSAHLFHYEGKTRGHGDSPYEVAAFRARYRNRSDKWYNPNLSLDNGHFTIQPYHKPLVDRERVRVAMVTHNLNHEGAPNSQLELAVGLKRLGQYDPIIVSPTDGPLRAEYEAAGIRTMIMKNPLAGAYTREQLDAQIEVFRAFLSSEGVEVVFGNTLQTFWAIHGARTAGLPAIWNPRESEAYDAYFDFLAPPLREIAYSCFSYPYKVIFVAHATRKAWEPLNSVNNFTVIHNGLDIDRFTQRVVRETRSDARARLGLADSEVAVILVGTVCERKGQMDLIRALDVMDKMQGARVRAYIVGDRESAYSGELHKELSRLRREVRERVTIVRECGDVGTYYTAGDIAVCTSKVESFPRVILEAMAAGLPIVSTPVFGIREQIWEDVNGFFYEPGRARELAQNLSKLVVDADTRQRFGRNSRAVLETLPQYDEMVGEYAKRISEAQYTQGRAYGERWELMGASGICAE